MDVAFREYNQNPVMAVLLREFEHHGKVKRIRASMPMLRNPFLEISYQSGATNQISIAKAIFAKSWAEALVVLGVLTDIELISDLRYLPDVSNIISNAEVLQVRDEAIAEASEMFQAGSYRVFLEQFGENYAGLPNEIMTMIQQAKSATAGHNHE